MAASVFDENPDNKASVGAFMVTQVKPYAYGHTSRCRSFWKAGNHLVGHGKEELLQGRKRESVAGGGQAGEAATKNVDNIVAGAGALNLRSLLGKQFQTLRSTGQCRLACEHHADETVHGSRGLQMQICGIYQHDLYENAYAHLNENCRWDLQTQWKWIPARSVYER